MSSAEQHKRFMALAIETMRRTALEERSGEPFGAVVVKDGEVIANEGNGVGRDNDPTAHAEINAIRAAARALGTWDLSGCVLYASSRCCPMCYAAAHWAAISKIYYGAGWEDYSDFYDDSAAITEMNLPPERQAMAPEQLLRDEAIEVWNAVRQDRGMKPAKTD